MNEFLDKASKAVSALAKQGLTPAKITVDFYGKITIELRSTPHYAPDCKTSP
jgi:hypothetical protein